MGRINFGIVKPSFLIIGVQKGGTTSLHNYLIQHPKLISPNKKELHFFDTQDSLSIHSFLNFFPKEYLTNTISFESTPRYIYYPGVAKKIFEFNPKMKFIVLLRNPVKRAFSAWNMYQQMAAVPNLQKYFKSLEFKNSNEKFHSSFYKNEFPTFNEWVTHELSDDFNNEIIEPSVIRRGYYKEQIEHYLQYFPKKQFLFIESETLKKDNLNILNSISKFLKIKLFNDLEMDLKRSNERVYKNNIDSEMYEYLLDHYKIKNNGLEKLVNLKLNWM